MKHIGWCLEHMEYAANQFPRKLDTDEKKTKARSMLELIKGYAKTLSEILSNPKFREYLRQLEESSIEGISLQAHEIEQLIIDFEHTLAFLKSYITTLTQVIDSEPERWSSEAGEISSFILHKFGTGRGELRREFQVAIHTIDQLREVVSSEHHLAEFLK